MSDNMAQVNTKKDQLQESRPKVTMKTLKKSLHRRLKFLKNRNKAKKESENRDVHANRLERIQSLHNLAESVDYQHIKKIRSSSMVERGTAESSNDGVCNSDDEQEHTFIYTPVSYCNLSVLIEVGHSSSTNLHVTRPRSLSLNDKRRRSELSATFRADIVPRSSSSFQGLQLMGRISNFVHRKRRFSAGNII